ncbi:class I SAM-dependent methyltransferase [Brevundimonas staleyi]|uniref:Class I SAM-dependent methyltransferase n=1 Tax=Brevundimonas staleyi TaxID=74326 RepID=A0ABW0FSU8_9CAUL
MISAEEVVQGYNLILGRNPESEAVIEGHRSHADRLTLWRVLASSEEFAAGSPAEAAAQVIQARTLFDGPWPIQHEANPEQLAAMTARIERAWSRLGEEDPYWSVLTADRYRGETVEAAVLEEFWASGRRHAGLVDVFERRTGRVPTRGVCLEIGCGVGRVTGPLAERFDEVIALDISPGNLAICERRMADLGLDHVDCRRIAGLDDFDRLPEADFVFSTHVLQHNPPPVQRSILRSVLTKIRPGGAILFQVPTDVPGYSFDIDAYLHSPEMGLEMHALPRAVVLADIREAGLELLDVTPDPFTGVAGSMTFYAGRP